MRFGFVAVVRCQKHVVYVYNAHSDEISRRVTQSEEGRVQFERCPRVSWSVSRSSFHQPQGSRAFQKHLSQSRSVNLSRLLVSHVQAAQKTKTLGLLEAFFEKMQSSFGFHGHGASGRIQPTSVLVPIRKS